MYVIIHGNSYNKKKKNMFLSAWMLFQIITTDQTSS